MDEGRLGLLGILFEFIDENRKLPMVGDGKNRYQFIYAKDLARACELALDTDYSDIFNIGSDDVKTFNEVYQYVINNSDSKSLLLHFPKLPMVMAMKICFWLGISPLGPYQYKMIASSFVFDTSKIKQKLGFVPTLKNEEMLLRAYEFYHQNKKEILERKDVSAHNSVAKMGIIKLLKWMM
jgi:nucleoside-diphosphate-sugar epimerase